MVEAYLEVLPAPLLAALAVGAEPVAEVPGLSVAAGLRQRFPRVETVDSLALVVEVHRQVAPVLDRLLRQREQDRAFIDARTREAAAHNASLAIDDPDYRTVLGERDADGRVVVGPLPDPPEVPPVAVPPFLQGEQVTLFGPPDTAKMSINAMNALHRRRADEPALVAELVAASGQVPRWGADDEDSQTPVMELFLAAVENLMGCYDRTLCFTDEARGKTYQLAESGLSRPLKRIPGLALPDGSHLLDGQPLPLHLFDFVTHVWHNRHRPEALVFYVPKLENEEEAAYLRLLIEATDAAVRRRDPACDPATVQVLLVFESPRAIFRIREMAVALGPHFLGGSLGWHDFLAATARLFRHDPAYRIPSKSDPDIVIKHIAESHHILADSLRDCGAMRIGGMYGVLFEEREPWSYQVSMVGYIRDVVTQLRRGLTGYWVAHPDFVRTGLALVEAWRRDDPALLRELVVALVPEPRLQGPLLDFVFGEDAPGLSSEDPRYLRAVLASDLQVSDHRPNHHPEEVRYNVFQALQYLASWLMGTGCVALPATLPGPEGPVFVRVMDDLATTERSRWEVWAEIAHGRVPLARFEQILAEEVAFLQAGQDTPTRRIQVRWEGEAARWYPIAVRVLRQLMTDPDPVEHVPMLTLPFTFPVVREAADPWAMAVELCPGRFTAARGRQIPAAGGR